MKTILFVTSQTIM